MPEGTVHLSRLMGEHRSVVIKEIKRKLKAGELQDQYQLVEAGDLDFPVVYRAWLVWTTAQRQVVATGKGGLKKGR